MNQHIFHQIPKQTNEQKNKKNVVIYAKCKIAERSKENKYLEQKNHKHTNH